MTLTISDMLTGMEAGRLQSVGLMQVIPLTLTDPNLAEDRLVSPATAPEAGEGSSSSFSTTSYGSMRFKNETDRILLIPLHAGYMVKQAAQDHAMSSAGLVAKNKTKTWKNAMCIQSSQGGYIREGDYRMLILPYGLRERAMEIREAKDYGKLWPAIEEFNRNMGMAGGSHLEFFLKQYEKELDQFVAEFELLPNQCGAIVLVGGYVVGFERAPSPEYWATVWEPLIRECYGSLAIFIRSKFPGGVPDPKTRVPIDMTGIDTLEDLERALDTAEEAEEETVRETIRKLLDDPFELEEEEAESDFRVITVSNDQFTGQVVRADEKISYASLFTTKKWAKDQPWREADKFAL